MKKFSFVIDVAKCENCNNCFLSCKDEHCGNDWPSYSLSQPQHGQRWMNISRKERGTFPEIDVAYLPKPCMHCDDAPCIKAAKDGAVHKREDGIVIIDPVKAKGQNEIVKSCPFGAIWWNKAEKIPQKCTFCAHLLDSGWKKTRCVQACPTGALSILHMEDEELKRRVVAEKLQTLEPRSGTFRPRCYYKNLYRFNDSFIAGSVARGDDKYSECVDGIHVKLLRGDAVIDEQETDDFGDFKFDRLTSGSGTYTVLFEDKESKIFQKKEVKLGQSVSLGTLWVD